MNRLKIAFTLLIILALAVIGYMLYSNVGLIVKKKVTPTLLDPKAEFSIKTAHFVEMKGERKVLEVDAEAAYYFRGNNLAELKKPEVVFYGEGRREVFFKGDEGIIDIGTNDVTVVGNVVMDSPDGYRLETSRLKYKADKMMVTTDKPIRIMGDVFDIKGIGMKSKVDEEVFYILKNVEAVFYLSSKGGSFAKTDKKK